MKHLIVLIASLIFVVLSSTNSVWGIDINVFRNGSGSQNTLNYNSTTDKSSDQSNNSTFKNKFPVSCQTGDNSASGNTGNGGTISTGNCAANINVTNNANNNTATLKCKDCPAVGGPEQPKPGQPGQPGQPTSAAPAGGQAGGGGEVAGVAAPNPQALAVTGEKEASILALTGLSSLLIGAWQLRKNALGLTIKSNR